MSVQYHDADERIMRLTTQLTNLRPFWPKLIPLFVGWMRQQFETEGAFGGEPWAELSPEYAARKAKRWGNRGILYASGDLRMAASYPQREMTATTLILTIDDSDKKHGGKVARAVAQYHQEGTDRMPARPLLFDLEGSPAGLEVEVAAELYADEIIKRSGL